MNYYERHLGDYARDAGHLSMAEHGAYNLLLDRYYTTEQPIPNLVDAYRICRARTRDEKASVDAVLREFFVSDGEAFLNRRAEAEIKKARSKIEAARTNGKRGGRPKKNPEATEEKPSGFSLGTPGESSPDTRHQTPDKEEGRATTPVAVREPVSVEGHKPSHAGLICRAMKAKGIHDVNPGHPLLMQLIAQGASDVEFEGAALDAANRGKGFAYALAALQGRRRDAATVTLSDPVPAKPEAPSVSPSIEATRRLLAEQAAVVATKPPAELLQRLRGIAGAVKP